MHSLEEFVRRCQLIVVLVVLYVCTGCAQQKELLQSKFFEDRYLSSLPTELSGSHVRFDQLLGVYDNLNDWQKGAVLEHFLGQVNVNKEENAQAAYMLARIYQDDLMSGQNNGNPQVRQQKYKQTIVLYSASKIYAPLKDKSFWHLIETAALGGEEKLLRQMLNEKLNENGTLDKAAVNYALAQSYLRTNELSKAAEILNQIRSNFPNTDYALAAGYYLATMNAADKTQIKQSFRYYWEYLQLCPDGRFSKDILAKLTSLEKQHRATFTANEFAVLANAYFVNSMLEQSLRYWRKAGTDKHLLDVAQCLLKLGQTKAAEEFLLKAAVKNANDAHCLPIAELLSNELSRDEAIIFWNKLRGAKIGRQDAVLWQIAIREPLIKALNDYQQLLARYPQSVYAPEAQWRLVWSKFKSSKGVTLQNGANLCRVAAKKYNQSKLASRFLFWAGKISEMLRNKEQALADYQKAIEFYGNDYYGQRSRKRLNVIGRIGKDDYFVLQRPIELGQQNWDWPYPESALQQLRAKKLDTLYVLIYLKQYSEALLDSNNIDPEIKSWLLGKTAQPLLAINMAFECLREKERSQNLIDRPSKTPLWQYSFPLLYDESIKGLCRGTSLTDPFIMHALIREESRYNSFAVSQSKALGLCQLMPSTATGLAKSLGLNIQSNKDLFQPYLNTRLGSAYLANLVSNFHGNMLLAVASYNAGANAVKSKVTDKENFVLGDPDYFVEDFPYRETRDYIRKVFSSYWLYREIYTINVKN